MYLLDFIKDIDLLREPNIPDIPSINTSKDVIFLSSESAKDLKKYIDNFADEKRILTPYINLKTLQVEAYDITEINNYINRLSKEKIINKFNCLSKHLAETIIFEGIWLFDLVADLPKEKSFISPFKNGISQVYALYHNNKNDDEPVLLSFAMPIEMEMFLAQFKYFIIKYCNCRLKYLQLETDAKEEKHFNFDDLMKDIIAQYYKKPPLDDLSVKAVMDINNFEFDIFIQQLVQIS